MQYAIELYFDRETEAFLQSLVQRVADAGLSTKFIEYRSRPHLTLACYSDVDEDVCIHRLQEYAATHQAPPAFLGSIGMFTDTKTIFTSPVMNRGMYRLQEELHALLHDQDSSSWVWYTPDRWVPHCTLALLKDDPDEAFYKAAELLMRNFRKTAGTFDRIGLVRVTMPVEEIFTVELGK